jgi:hydroxymethylglutaryl-CoA reductase (NADPH)
VKHVLNSTPKAMNDYWRSSTLAVVQSGAIGAQGHVANGLTAIFIACGQDAACISEASVGLTRMELTDDGDLYVSVTLPGLIVGTVGGGTSLPTQRECLEILDCYGSGKARKFAEICGALALAGEISIAAAMSSGEFAQAHEQLGRKKAT